MLDTASDEDLRLAPAHEAILGGPTSPQAGWLGSHQAANDADCGDVDDMYAGLDLAACPPTSTAFPVLQNSAYKPQQTQPG